MDLASLLETGEGQPWVCVSIHVDLIGHGMGATGGTEDGDNDQDV